MRQTRFLNMSMVFALALSACSGGASEDSSPSEGALLVAAHDLVRAGLKDPDSAQFRNDRIVKFKGKSVACGEVNANNSFGGKAGYKRYVAAGETAVVTEEAMEPAEFEKVWAEICQ